MVLNSKNSGKWLSSDFLEKRQEILRDLNYRDTLTTFEKNYYEVNDLDIGSIQNYDHLTEQQKRDRGII